MISEKNEHSKIINEISEKFGYDEDLTRTLGRVVNVMLDEKSEEEKDVFYKMLKHTPIVVLPYDTKLTEDELVDKYIGNVNPHMVDEKKDLGAYGEGAAAGAFCSEAILDQNLNLTGVKQFIYIKRFANFTRTGEKAQEMFGTDINVSHLIHELGHAENAEIEQYKIKDNIITQRVGTTKIKAQISKTEDGMYRRKEIGRTGLMLEEAINTSEEQAYLMKYLGIDKEQLNSLYKEGILVPSSYQGLMADITDHLMKNTSAEDIRMWRLTGDNKYIETISKAMSETDPYKKRMDETEHIRNKREIFSIPTSEKMKNFFEKYHDDFFADKSNMTPMDLLNNCLQQCYDIKTHNFSVFDIYTEEGRQKYTDVLNSVLKEGYVLINQTKNVLEKNKVSMKKLAKNALQHNITEEEVNNSEKNNIQRNSKDKENKDIEQ